MAIRFPIMRATTFIDYAKLSKALRAPVFRPLITRSQGDAIADACEPFLSDAPNITLEQRTPKGTVYLLIDGALAFTIDQRAVATRVST